MNANLLPTDDKAERSLVATLMASPRLLHEVLPVLETSEILSHPAYRLLLETIQAIHAEGKPLKQMSILQRLNGSGGTKVLIDHNVSLIDMPAEAREVDCLETAYYLRGLWIKRNAVESASAIIRAVANGETTDQVVDRLAKSSDQASKGRSVGSDKSMGDILAQSISNMERAMSKPDALTGVPTGLGKLDRHFGGWQPTDVIVIAGRPGSGKSVVGLAHTLNAARQNVPVAFLSLEMPADSLINRAISEKTKIHYSDIKKGKIAPHEFQWIHNAVGELTSLPIHFYDDTNRDVNDLSAKLLYWKQKHGIGLVVIDYVQLMTDRTVKSTAEYDVLTSVSKKLKQLQRKLECPLIELAQLNRSVESRVGSKRPMMSDLKSTGQFEQDASVIIMLYREDYYAEKAEHEAAEQEGRPYRQPAMSHNLEYGIVKNRDGFTGTATLWCDVATNQLLDSEPTWHQPTENAPF